MATDLPKADSYSVEIRETGVDRRLVAAIEIVSPSNKDRPENRRAFAAKCVTMLRERVSVVVVDLVTTRAADLRRDVFDLAGMTGVADGEQTAGPIHACSSRCRRAPDGTWLFETWSEPLTLGEPLPVLPLWLASNLAVPLDLERSYEETFRILRIS